MTTDPAAGITEDLTALHTALTSIGTYQQQMRDEITALEAKIAANPTAPVSSIDLSALKTQLDAAVSEAQQLGVATAAPTGGGTTPDPTGGSGAVGSGTVDPGTGGSAGAVGSGAAPGGGGTPGVSPPSAGQ